jgi:hypothetical protein
LRRPCPTAASTWPPASGSGPSRSSSARTTQRSNPERKQGGGKIKTGSVLKYRVEFLKLDLLLHLQGEKNI